jgi:Ca-activated chloride channel homolog
MKNLKIFSSCIFMLLFFQNFAQEITVKGKVWADGQPLPGASVVVKGTTKGTTTDFMGEFRIEVTKGDKLVVSYLGYVTREVAVTNEIVNVTLIDDNKKMQLCEVVVVGYGTAKKKDRTGSVTRIKAAEISKANYSSISRALAGKVAGVNITTISSDKQKKIRLANNAKSNDKEKYDLIENTFESPKTAPLSTFSIDVDNASYTNIRKMLNSGQKVPKDMVRVEEMMNFFKYNYPQPLRDHPFSINTEYSECPWNADHKLVKIGLQGKNLDSEKLPPSNLVFLIDVSGSMNQEDKLPLLVASFKVLVAQLRKEDNVSIVVYAGAAGMVLPPTSGAEKSTIINALDKLHAGGSTAGGAGIALAYKIAEENFIKGGNNRVVLATDGDFNVGASSDEDMQVLIEEKRKSGVFLTCLGFGMGNYKDKKMEILADKGNGNYAYIDTMQEANRFLGKEFKGSMFAIAKDVKIQIEFNPIHVQAYRLIGYENRKLRPEDFQNDAIDAGELGSNHNVTALYEIIPAGFKSKFYNEAAGLKYVPTTHIASNFNDELATIKFRYKKPDGDKSTEIVHVIENKSVDIDKASSDFKFTTAVAWFGLKLRESRLVSISDSDDIALLATEGISADKDGYKAEFVRLVEAINY